MGLINKKKNIIKKIMPLTNKRKEQIDKIVQHAKIDADSDIEKWIKILFPDMDKEDRYIVESLCNETYEHWSYLMALVNKYKSDEEDDNEE